MNMFINNYMKVVLTLL